VILAVKPDVIIPLVRNHAAALKQKPVISIAAGIAIASVKEALGGGTVIRVMPNTPALIGQGMSVISADASCDGEILKTVEMIFACLGKTMQLPEKLMDAVTALSGCGPAYAFTVIQAMADGGVKLGIPRDKALVLAAQTLAGAANMALASDKGPIELRGMVTSPGGSTIEAVHCLERAGFSGTLIDAIEAAARKSEKLGGTKS
jgi:pyrroline-5-carboxylate reductase